MKQDNQAHKSLSNSVKKLSRQQFIIFVMLAVSAASYSWLKLSQPSEQYWDHSSIKLPSKDQLQQRIDQKIAKESFLDQRADDLLDNIIDHQAMQTKLSGLTKNVTLTREPTTQELNTFYSQNKKQYRQPSTFHFKQYLFANTQYGGQAINKAQQVLDTSEANRGQPSDLIHLNSLNLDRLYGNGFSEKLLNLAMQNPQNLPCWTKPITSKVGAHLICFEKVDIGAIPKLDSIKPQLINHWRYETAKRQSNKK